MKNSLRNTLFVWTLLRVRAGGKGGGGAKRADREEVPSDGRFLIAQCRIAASTSDSHARYISASSCGGDSAFQGRGVRVSGA